jgi:hypothetical protein
MPQKIEIEGFEVNLERARQVVLSALEMKSKGFHPFDNSDLFPDAVVPRGIVPGSLEHRAFLFHSVSLDSMMNARLVYEAMRALIEQVDITQLHNVSKEVISRILEPTFGKRLNAKNSMAHPRETLHENSKMLHEMCGGDPRNLYSGFSRSSPASDEDIRETIDRIDEFRQYGIPKAALLVKNFVRFEIWDFDRTRIPIKIDRHLLRISLGAGVIDAQQYAKPVDWGNVSKVLDGAKNQLIKNGMITEDSLPHTHVLRVPVPMIEALTEAYLRITRQDKIDAIELDDAKWAIGAYLCKRNDALYCVGNCLIDCEKRYPSDNNACYFFVNVDKRKSRGTLFT